MIYFLPVFRHRYFKNLFAVVYFKNFWGAGSSGKSRYCSGGYLGSVPRTTSDHGLSSPALLPGELTLLPPRAPACARHR